MDSKQTEKLEPEVFKFVSKFFERNCKTSTIYHDIVLNFLKLVLFAKWMIKNQKYVKMGSCSL